MNGTVMTTTAADMDRLFQANVGFIIENIQLKTLEKHYDTFLSNFKHLNFFCG
jgi:hypothetical protein